MKNLSPSWCNRGSCHFVVLFIMFGGFLVVITWLPHYDNNLIAVYGTRLSIMQRRSLTESYLTPVMQTVCATSGTAEQQYRCPVTFLGCVVNKLGFNRMFEHVLEVNVPALTPKKCIVACFNHGLELSAVQGTQCVCSKFMSVQQTIDVDPQGCNRTCPGNPAKTCGGNNTMQIYYRTGPCRKGPFFQRDARQAEYGCFPAPGDKQTYSTVATSSGYMQPIECVMTCETQDLPFAVMPDPKTCFCVKFIEFFNHSHAVNNSYCDRRCSGDMTFPKNDLRCGGQGYVSVWRTLVENRCGEKNYLPPNTVPPVALVSMPGSGNSWLRYLLETAGGVYTGSVYHSMPITRKGMFGELDPIDSNRTLTIKDHVIYRGITGYPHRFKKIILLLRNPFDALIAEFNRRINGSQTGHVADEDFKIPRWQGYIKWIVNGYSKVYKDILTGDLPLLVIIYDDLKSNKNREIKRILDFVGYHPIDLDERLQCLGRNDVGYFKRTKVSVNDDPYTKRNVEDINSLVFELRSGLMKIGYKSLPAWERDI